jgi:hypothetical protein
MGTDSESIQVIVKQAKPLAPPSGYLIVFLSEKKKKRNAKGSDSSKSFLHLPRNTRSVMRG